MAEAACTRAAAPARSSAPASVALRRRTPNGFDVILRCTNSQRSARADNRLASGHLQAQAALGSAPAQPRGRAALAAGGARTRLRVRRGPATAAAGAERCTRLFTLACAGAALRQRQRNPAGRRRAQPVGHIPACVCAAGELQQQPALSAARGCSHWRARARRRISASATPRAGDARSRWVTYPPACTPWDSGGSGRR